jgi:hypothetical protein
MISVLQAFHELLLGLVQGLNQGTKSLNLLQVRFGSDDFVFKLLARVSDLSLRSSYLIPLALDLTLQVHDLQLVLILPLLSSDLLSLALVNNFEESLHFGLG